MIELTAWILPRSRSAPRRSSWVSASARFVPADPPSPDDPQSHALCSQKLQTHDLGARLTPRGRARPQGFLKKKTRDLSGGWRMRVALARALLIQVTAVMQRVKDPICREGPSVPRALGGCAIVASAAFRCS